jgi:hypothetical protein
MKIRPLIIDDHVLARVREVVTYALATKMDIQELRARGAPGSVIPPVGDDDQRVVELPFGYRFVFSIEEQPFGWARHLSVSVDEVGMLPNEVAVETMMEHFGMGKLADAKMAWVEKLPGQRNAINVISKMEEPAS